MENLQNPRKGILRCPYDMLSFSVGERKRPGPSRRSSEIAHVTEKALNPVLKLESFPNSVVDLFIMIIQANAGTRTAVPFPPSFVVTHAAPVRSAIEAISWLAEPNEGHTTVKLPLHASHIPIRAGTIDATHLFVIKL